jgi:class 3 adenylate cyclase
MQTSRQLAAIMFTDIVGYTSLMGRDEQEAMALLQENQQIQTSSANKHNGQMLKEMGDGPQVRILLPRRKGATQLLLLLPT